MSETTLVGRLSKTMRQAWQQLNSRSSRFKKEGEGGVGSKANLLFLRARTMARAGDFEMAGRLYADAAALEPTLAEAFEGHGEILDLTGHRELSAKQYEFARSVRTGLRPGMPDRHFVLRQRGHYVAEILAYDSVLRSLKKNALPHLARGNAHLVTGRPAEALADYDRALALKPKLLEIAALRGEALTMLGRYPEALKAFDVALAKCPNDPEILSGRAIARIASGRVDEANADWRRQFDLLGDRAAARACVALRLADYEAALAELKIALVKEPRDPYWHLYRLTAQHRLGGTFEAIELPQVDVWPGPLLALYNGRISEDEVLKQANTDGRRAEALFQMGVLALARDRALAGRHWREVVKRAAPSLIEYAAACNELARLGP